MRNVAEVRRGGQRQADLFFPARHDHWLVQTGDGWAAHVAGAIGVSTDAQASWWAGAAWAPSRTGSSPPTAATRCARRRSSPTATATRWNVTVLVELRQRLGATALEVAEALGDRLWGVRRTPARRSVDKALEGTDLRGVQPQLVEKVRAALDDAGHERVRIVVSGGFTAAKIADFEARDIPGRRLRRRLVAAARQNDFTADVVEVDGRPCAKVGRETWPQPAAGAGLLTHRLGAACSTGSTTSAWPSPTSTRALRLYDAELDLAVVHRETVERRASRAVLLDVGENHVELLAPLGRGHARREVPRQPRAGPSPRRLPDGRHRGRAGAAEGGGPAA